MRVLFQLLLAAIAFTSSVIGGETQGQLRQVEPSPVPLPLLFEGLASIGNAYQLNKAESLRQENLSKTPPPTPTPAATSQAHTPKPDVVAASLSCRAKKQGDAVLVHLAAIEDTLKAIQTLLETHERRG